MDEFTGKDFGLKNIQGRPLVTSELARVLRVSERWIQNGIKEGTFPIPYYPISPRIHVFDSAKVDAYLGKIMAEAGAAQLPLKAIRKLKKEAVNS